jgi:hypothetical protein
LYKHTIKTGDSAPIRSVPYRMPHALRDKLRAELDGMLENGLISRSTSPWGSPIVYVPKSDGTLRLCTDFRKLNAVAEMDINPLPRIDDIFGMLNNVKIMTSLDLCKGFWQLELDPETKHKTSMVTCLGQYEYNVLPFGLNSAPGAFQRAMAMVLMGLEWEKCLIYLDDILVFSTSFEQHLKDLSEVFDRFREANLKLKVGKCQFGRNELKYLGHVINSEGIKPDPGKISAIKDFAIPKNLKGVESFLGLAGYYHKFVPNFSNVSEPLNELKRKDVKFVWTPECQKAMDTMKDSLVKEPLLIYPDFTKPFIVQTDASGFAMGAVISQEVGKGVQPIAYASKALLSYQRRYHAIEKECLAIRWATLHFKHYLYGHKFWVETDHKPLKALFNAPPKSSRIAQWRNELLVEFGGFEIRYRPGKANGNADGLSRDPGHEPDKTEEPEEEVLNVFMIKGVEEENIEWHTLAQGQKDDPEWGPMRNFLENMTLPIDNDQQAKRILLWSEYFGIFDDILMKIEDTSEEGNLKPVIPNVFRKEVMRYAHEGNLGHHQGINATIWRIKAKYYWETLMIDARKWVKTCGRCEKKENEQMSVKIPLRIMEQVRRPMQKMHMEIIEINKISKRGNRFFIGFFDEYTKYITGYGVKNEEPDICARTFIRGVVSKLGTPNELVSDQNTNFNTKLHTEVCNLTGKLTKHIASYGPQINSEIRKFQEQMDFTLGEIDNYNEREWDELLPYCLMAYNTTVHNATNDTPFYQMHGFDPNLPEDPGKRTEEIGEYLETYNKELAIVIQGAWAKSTMLTRRGREQQVKDYANVQNLK